MHHRLPSTPETVHWGWFDAALPHVLTVESGDQVTIESLSGGPANLPGDGFTVPPELLDVHAKAQRRIPGHILTGPIGVRGAAPGDVLEIRILEVDLRQDWGYTYVRPLAGALPRTSTPSSRSSRDSIAARRWAPCHGVSSFRCVPSSA
jgi:acetamidase/formamidase